MVVTVVRLKVSLHVVGVGERRRMYLVMSGRRGCEAEDAGRDGWAAQDVVLSTGS